MKINFAVICCVIVLFSANLSIGKTNKSHSTERVTILDNRELDYDVKHLKFNLHATDTSVYLWGDVSTTAQVVATTMSTYVFELDTLMVIDSAKVNGVLLPVTGVDSIRTITLPTALAANAFFTAQIFYHGVPPPGGGFFNGLSHTVSSGGTNLVYTVSDPWAAMNWWPAKQDADDKIDSVDMIITVPRGVVDGSNGVLISVDSATTPGFYTYHWQTHYPIDYYLISIAVARFSVKSSYLHFTGSTDSMLIQNFFIDTATFYPAYLPMFDSIGLIIDYYSSLFGRYPFWREKYGVCYTTLPGGMENQTMTTIGVPINWIVAHELMHQWFGDHVTYATWGEMWLSEGFACFSEQLFLEHFCGAAAALAHRQGYLNSIFTKPCGEVYVTDTSGPNTLFDQATVYHKGQGIVTMLRYLAPSDAVFFQVLRDYQQAYAYGNASIAQLNAIVDSEYGYSVDSFFNEWVYGKGFPVYTVSWNQVGTSVYVKLIQQPSCTTTPTHFNTPVELELNSPLGDTIVWAFNTVDTQIFTYTWADSMSGVTVNPDALTICWKRGVIVQDTTLGINSPLQVMQSGPMIFPNPTGNFWTLAVVAENTPLILSDINGKAVWKGRSNRDTTIIPGKQLPPGDYFLKIGSVGNVKLTRN